MITNINRGSDYRDNVYYVNLNTYNNHVIFNRIFPFILMRALVKLAEI